MASGTWGDPNVYTKAETDAAIAQSTAISERGDIQITSATAGASLYGAQNFYMRYNKVVFIHFSFKLEGATVGKVYSIAVNLPTSCLPPYASIQSVMASNGSTTGSTGVNYSSDSGFTIYADRDGTTYAIGTLMYLIT